MKPETINCSKTVLQCLLLCMLMTARAQELTTDLQRSVNNDNILQTSNIQFPLQLKDFYRYADYHTAWINNPASIKTLINLITGADSLGLNEKYYSPVFLRSLMDTNAENLTDADLVLTDMRITDIAIHFFSDIAYGNRSFPLKYNGLKYTPDCLDLPYLLHDHLNRDKLNDLVRYVEPELTEYTAIKKNIISLNKLNTADNRLPQLNTSINFYRWLNCILKTNEIIIVNIPAATLTVYRNAKPELSMKVIVGKPSTPTPVLSSMIDQVVLYPYWIVPQKIAARELLPLIKKNIKYLSSNNFQVISRQGRIVDPATINWHSLSASNFPYTLRQSTGCDNSLGLIKLNFDSPYSVYLHDTPWRLLFAFNKRFFSHGCIRLEKPVELARLLLDTNRIAVDTLDLKAKIVNKPPVFLKAGHPLPVIIWYNLVSVDAENNILFNDDVYNKYKKWSLN